MKIGIFGGSKNKPSGVVSKISESLQSYNPFVLNGFDSDLPTRLDYDLSIWMMDIDNSIEKKYPIKKRGSVLVCSKLMHDGVTEIEAVSRIFKMHGNAVICIYTNEKPFTFKLIDALGNTWYHGNDISDLSSSILNFKKKCDSSTRVGSVRRELGRESVTEEELSRLNEFIEINKQLSGHIQTSCGDRFFGNISTRCAKLFPTCWLGNVWVSPRNSNKETIEASDMVLVKYENDVVEFDGVKPSVDTPVQLKIYEGCPHINYMIHGHAFIKSAVTTDEYYFCGDLRESTEVISYIHNSAFPNHGAINLRNHGFLIFSSSIDGLSRIIDTLDFSYERDAVTFL